MKEYRVCQQIGDSKPYSFYTYNNFSSAYVQLLNLINLQQSDLKKEYYVLNDFYDNKYPPFLKNIKKYWIEVRNVDNWEIATKESENENKNTNIIKIRYKDR